MKRILTFLLAGIMMLTLAACGNSAPAESASENETQTSNSTNVQTESCLFAQQEKDGIRKKERMRSVCVKEAL